MSFVMIEMVTAIMFYGRRDSDDEFDLSIDDYHLYRQELIIGFECLLISASVSVVIVAIFRNVLSRRSYTKIEPGEVDEYVSFTISF